MQLSGGNNKSQGNENEKGQTAAYVTNANSESQDSVCVLDSVASHHIINDDSNISNVSSYSGSDGAVISNVCWEKNRWL